MRVVVIYRADLFLQGSALSTLWIHIYQGAARGHLEMFEVNEIEYELN